MAKLDDESLRQALIGRREVPRTLGEVCWGDQLLERYVIPLIEEYPATRGVFRFNQEVRRNHRRGGILSSNLDLAARVHRDLTAKGIKVDLTNTLILYLDRKVPEGFDSARVGGFAPTLPVEDYLRLLADCAERDLPLPQSLRLDAVAYGSDESWGALLKACSGREGVWFHFPVGNQVVDRSLFLEIVKRRRVAEAESLARYRNGELSAECLGAVLSANVMPSAVQILDIDENLTKAIIYSTLPRDGALSAGGWKIVKAFMQNSAKPAKYSRLLSTGIRHGVKDPELISALTRCKGVGEALHHMPLPGEREKILRQCPMKDVMDKHYAYAAEVVESHQLTDAQVAELVAMRGSKVTFGQALDGISTR